MISEEESQTKEAAAEPEAPVFKYLYSTAFRIVLDKEFNKSAAKSLRKYLETIGDCVTCEHTEEEVRSVSD